MNKPQFISTELPYMRATRLYVGEYLGASADGFVYTDWRAQCKRELEDFRLGLDLELDGWSVLMKAAIASIAARDRAWIDERIAEIGGTVPEHWRRASRIEKERDAQVYLAWLSNDDIPSW